MNGIGRVVPTTDAHVRAVALSVAVGLICLGAGASAAAGGGATHENDNFGSAQTLDPGFSAFGTLEGATSQPNEPNHAGNAGFNSRWWTTTAGVNGRLTLDACYTNNDPDTVLAVYTGTQLSSLAEVAAADDGCGSSNGARLQFAAVAGTTYYFALANSATPEPGNATFELHLGAAPANDLLADAESVSGASLSATSSNTDAFVEAGEPEHGAPGGSSIWFKWVAPSANPVALNTCGSAFANLLAVYSAPTLTPGPPDLIAVGSGAGCSESGAVVFTPANGQTYWIALDGPENAIEPGGQQGDMVLNLASKPANDDFGARQTLPGFPSSASVINLAATLEPSEPSHGDAEYSVWYSWTPTATSQVAAGVCNSVVPARVDVYVDTNSTLSGLQAVPSQEVECGQQSRKLFDAVSGTTYAIAVSSLLGGAVELNLGSPPDTTKPDLTIKKLSVNKKRRIAKVVFTGSDPATPNGPSPPLGFKCKLDNGSYKACSSPKKFKKLKPGKHTVYVRATDGAGNSTVATKRFKLPRR